MTVDRGDAAFLLGGDPDQIAASAAARASNEWPAVTAAARHCLAALVIAGGWVGPDAPGR
ncbi:MAG TPA: hypothetical protein VFM01_14530 [Nakamurella sp.]|nr:hypothetical protein [Nakamurella sp.]